MKLVVDAGPPRYVSAANVPRLLSDEKEFAEHRKHFAGSF
jgi:hypothetical protein